MKKATFMEGVGIALIASIAVAVLFTVMSSMFIGSNVFMLLVAGLSFLYISYLLLRSKERTGRITVIVIWSLVTLISLVFISSLILYVAIQLMMVWLMRSLYFYNSIFSALIDLTMTVMSLAIAIWALTVSGSLFLTFWSFFLVQALFVYIPKNFIAGKKSETESQIDDDKFEYAHHAAEIAVAKLFKTN
ncbi:MAG: hypothetical protein OQK95_03840 [Gammaproteobacteria bacterium]|nr:hypothetical protein [Gammaproteobacteria bacterium]